MVETAMPQDSKTRPLIIAAVGFLLLFETGVLLAGFPRSLAGNGDFSAFYRTAVMARSGELHSLYDVTKQDSFDRQVFPSLDRYPPYYFYHPPYEVLWLLLLGLGLFKFQFIIPLIAILAFRRRAKLISAFLLTSAALLAVSWVLVGTSGLRLYWNLLSHHTPEMVWRMPNLRGLVESLGGSP